MCNLKIGVVVCFVGMVCDLNEGELVVVMEFEYYFGMIEKVFEKIVVEVGWCWLGIDVVIVYCVGRLLLFD